MTNIAAAAPPLVVLLTGLAALIGASPSPSPAAISTSGSLGTSELPELFDFGNYQKQFNKRYISSLETSTRQVYFLANTLQVYAASIGYRSRKQGHYLALNYMSDWSPSEWQSVQDQTIGASGAASDDAAGPKSSEPTAMKQQETDPALMAASLIDEIKRELDRLNRDEERQAEPKRRRREKRAAADGVGPRALLLDKLIQRSRSIGESPEVLAKIQKRPQVRKNYNSLAMGLMSRGLDDQQESIKKWKIPAGDPGDPAGALVKQNSLSATEADLLSRSLSDLSLSSSLELEPLALSSNGEPLPDEMFLDLRQYGCMFQPRKQGQCGASYAFAGITMAEWYYCRSKDQLLAFSEQYMLDCGMAQIKGIRGCRGAESTDVVPRFIHNFGLELAGSWPYLEQDSRCFYPPETDLNTVGFMRMRIEQYVGISVQYWRRLLKNGPLLVAVAMPSDFRQYAGGVDSGENCAEQPNHTMVLVGHGREDGQEFWLLRNSFGTQWGEDGYYKLAKSAPKRCIHNQKGYAFGTRNGRDYSGLKTSVNKANERARTGMASERKRGRTPAVRLP